MLGEVWDYIVFIPDHCMSVYFTSRKHLITTLCRVPCPCIKIIYEFDTLSTFT